MTPEPKPRRRRVVLVLVLVGMAGGWAAWWIGRTDPPNDSVLASGSAPAPVADGDAHLRTLIVGTWTDDYKGKRTMTVRPDGSATMVVELKGLNALMGSRLRFDMAWSIEDGRLKKRTIGGEPAGRVSLILKTMGDRVDEPILELNKERLLLLDADGETKYDWRRVE